MCSFRFLRREWSEGRASDPSYAGCPAVGQAEGENVDRAPSVSSFDLRQPDDDTARVLIRDPVHGDISLTHLEAEVLDFPEVQRMRGIRQLGTASYVYPGCVHTRFDHSLGAAALARRIVTAVRLAGASVSAELEQAIVAATLLHDVTHLPFGHTLEDERRLFARHDKGDRLNSLLDAGLGDRLDRTGLGTAVRAILGAGGVDAVPRWAKQVVSSTIDADLLDYLRRDAYFAGLGQSYDDRIFRYFIIDDGELVIDMTKHGMERPDARSETVQLLRMRYFLTERVYYHHTKVAAGAMISKAVELARQHGALSEAELLGQTDGGLFAALKRVPETAPDRRIVGLVERLEQRRLLKRGYVISSARVEAAGRQELVRRYHESADNRRIAEERLALELGCDPAEVIVYCPALTMMKEAAARVRLPHGVTALNGPDLEGTAEIHALEQRYAALWRFYVFVPAEHRVAAAAVAASLFGYPCEQGSYERTVE